MEINIKELQEEVDDRLHAIQVEAKDLTWVAAGDYDQIGGAMINMGIAHIINCIHMCRYKLSIAEELFDENLIDEETLKTLTIYNGKEYDDYIHDFKTSILLSGERDRLYKREVILNKLHKMRTNEEKRAELYTDLENLIA